MTLDIIIKGGYLLTMADEAHPILERSALGIKGNRIAAVGTTDEILKQYSAHRYIDAEDKVIMPGLVDCHMHSSDAIARGTAQDIEEWLYKGIWPVLRFSDENDTKIGSLVNLIESVKNGTTTISDDVNGSLQIVENHLKLGTRLIICEMINELPQNISEFEPRELFPFDKEKGSRKFHDNIRLAERYHGGEDQRIHCMLGPQAANMCSLELLREIYDYAQRHDLGIHMHVAQSPHENFVVEKRYGKQVIPYLEEHNMLNSRLLAIHLSYATEDEMKTLIRHGSRMVLCSNSIGLIRGKVPPAIQYRKLSGAVGLGTDQAPGNNRNNIFNEMRSTVLLGRCHAGDRSLYNPWQLLRMATLDGARTLGLESEIGTLEAGKKADIILVDLRKPSMQPVKADDLQQILQNLAFSANGSEVNTVLIDGKVIVDDGRLLTVDEPKAIAEANQAGMKFSRKLTTMPGIEELPLVKLTTEGYY